MYQDHMDGNIGHSNDSLFASADEMAGDYSPRIDNDGFPSLRGTPARSISYDSNGHSSSSSSEHVEVDYPMPDEPEIWKQAEHPDTINKLLNMTGDVCMEVFPAGGKTLSQLNPETFLMPLESRFICIKLEHRDDMAIALANGAVTNLPSCNERIDKVWNERDGQRVFMMFSISGAKEFCAMAEMLSPSQPGTFPGWSKKYCNGLVYVHFIFVKNVPYALINHIKHRGNGQPVANMWNSMMYHNNTGYHVARIYCQHPVLSSVLIRFKTEMQVNYKSQCRIPMSGNTAYSASSYGSRNDKSHDPRSATRPQIYRSGDRNRRGNSKRHAMHTRPWRDTGIPPTPSHQPMHFVSGGVMTTPTRTGREQRAILPQPGMAGATQSPPPPYPLGDTPYTPSQTSNKSTPSFTTEDERMLAQFASSRDAKRSGPNRTPRDFFPTSGAVADPFRDASMIHGAQVHVQSQAGFGWRGPNHGNQAPGFQSQPYTSPWHNNGGAPRGLGNHDQLDAGLGITPGLREMHIQQSQQPYPNEMVSHLPSPVTSSQPSHEGSSRSSEMHGNQSSGFVLPSPPAFNDTRARRRHGHPAPQSTPGAKQVGFTNMPYTPYTDQRNFTKPGDPIQHSQSMPVTNTPYTDQRNFAKPGDPIRHTQSMPIMVAQFNQPLSAQHLRDHNNDVKSSDADAMVAGSTSVQEWVAQTPTRTTAAKTKSSPDKALTIKAPTDTYESPEKVVRSADLPGKHKWHRAMADAAAIEIKVAQANGFPISEERYDQLTWHKAKADCLEVEIASARKEHDSARNEAAHEIAKRPTPSTSSPKDSTEWPSWTPASSSESRHAPAEVDTSGVLHRSPLKDREGKATHNIGQIIGHRRGNVNNGGFTGSFDARMNANIDNLISSPTRSNATPAMEPTRIHGHPAQRAHASATHNQYNSYNAIQYSDVNYNDDLADFASQIGPVEDDDENFPSRGRGHHHPQAFRDVSEVSPIGGIKLNDGYAYK